MAIDGNIGMPQGTGEPKKIRPFKDSDLDMETYMVDDITEILGLRGVDFDDPNSYQSKIKKLSEKYLGNKDAEDKIKIITLKILNDDNFFSQVKGWLQLEPTRSEETQEIPEKFNTLLIQWFKIGLDKNKIFENEKIKNLILDQLVDSAAYGPKKFSLDFKNWSEVGISLKDFLDSEELQEIINTQLANISKYDKKGSESKKQEWAECISHLKQ